MIQELFPDAKNVGLIYCSAEANSIYQITVIKGYLEEMGYTCTEFAFTDSNDVASVTQSAADASDVIYIPTDNTAAAYTETIANVVIPAKVPVVAGEEGICKGCGVATLTISYYDLGYKTVFWSLAYVDWYQDNQPDPQEAIAKLTKRIHPGAIVLLHSTSSTNAQILDELLDKWEAMGYSFHSLNEL